MSNFFSYGLEQTILETENVLIKSCVNRTETVDGTLCFLNIYLTSIVWNMCEHLHYEIGIFQRATQRARILLPDNIQSGGSCSVNHY